MAADGPAFYDDDDVFATYMARRQRADNPNETLEAPAFETAIGKLDGLRILDLGCGAASFGRKALDGGARTYVGVEGSRKMAAAGRETLRGTSASLIEDRVERWSYPTAAFDLVVSRLVLHYIEDLRPVFENINRTLVEGGRWVFSVEHPVITSCSRGWTPGTERQDWLVDDYFSAGARNTSWLGGEVRKYHRTIEDYFSAMQATGFMVEQLREARPRPDMFADATTYERRKRIPLFLILGGRKTW